MSFKQMYIWKNISSLIFNITVLILFLISVSFSTISFACTNCTSEINSNDSDIWEEAEEEFDDKIDQEFVRVEEFIIHEMWEQSILPAMMLAAEQFTAVAIQQAMAVGMFIDAESQLNAQRLLQELRAKTHKDYHPSVGMCEFGSLMKSLAATERRGEVTAVILSQRSQDRQLGARNSAGTYGRNLEHEPRILQFTRLFCSEKDRDSVLATICTNPSWQSSASNANDKERLDKDIDYFSLISSPWNLKLDFTNQEILRTSAPAVYNEDEEHVLAMASNLFAHDTFPRVPPGGALENHPERELTQTQKAYMDMRAIVAKRSVAENSFYAIAAMKAEGNRAEPTSGSSTPPPMSSRAYMEYILKELGVPDSEVIEVLGENPSYYAQMEILTKKAYQNPNFYTNLYDKPANVARKATALQAIKLMQKFDMLKSFLRNEASTSILLELAVINLQNEVEDRVRDIKAGRE